MLLLLVVSGIVLTLAPAPAAATRAPTAESAVELSLGWHVLVAPASLRVNVRVPRRPDNRSLEIVVESAEYLAASTVQLDGDMAPLVQQFQYKHLPAGSYDATATVERSDGSTSVDRLSFDVVGDPRDGPGDR